MIPPPKVVVTNEFGPLARLVFPPAQRLGRSLPGSSGLSELVAGIDTLKAVNGQSVSWDPCGVDDEEFTRWYGPWASPSITDVATMLRDFIAP